MMCRSSGKDSLKYLMKFAINKKKQELIGNRMAIEIIYADTIDKSPIGKAKLVEQELDIRDYLPGAFMDDGSSTRCCN